MIAALVAATIAGGAWLAFCCDDAFIHFRYAANAHAGAGIVWNAAPFRPVEGAGFLWVLVLWGIWAVFGVEPPDAANPFSIGCGVVQVLLLAAAARRLRDRDGTLLPWFAGACAVAAIVANRTFLQWLSSGLDTALFNVFLFWWVLHACRGPRSRAGSWLAVWALAAAMAALTRPDGLPLVGATAGVAAWLVVVREVRWSRALAGLAPLLLVAAHVAWRRCYYGEWLPNTYFAKVVAAWPEAGLRYFACFALENGAWLWLAIGVVWLAVHARHPLRALAALRHHAPAVAAVGVVLFNAGYYLLKVGGDHFEYRVLSPLAPLGVLASVAMVARLTRGAVPPIAAAAALALAGGVGWAHWVVSADADPVRNGVKPMTPYVPAFAQPLARWFDRQQLWLFVRYIGLRCHHHAQALAIYRTHFAGRQRVATAAEPFPVLATGAVGLPSWYLPDCAIVDEFGLNDWVVARTPTPQRAPVDPATLRAAVAAADAGGDGWLALPELRHASAAAFGTDPDERTGDFMLRFFVEATAVDRPDAVTRADAVALLELLDAPRRMAHERTPPPGYVAAFDPNVTVAAGVVTVRPRAVPLTADRIRAIEAEWRAKVERGAQR